MIIFQTAGNGGASVLGMKRALRTGVPSTTFRNNAYIHRLNRTLQAEMRAISAYRSLKARPSLDVLTTGHQYAGKELVRLIIANRGLPEDRSALSLGLTKTFIQLCEALPSRLTERATYGTLRQLERQLMTNYRKLLVVAPARDVAILTGLLGKAKKQSESLG